MKASRSLVVLHDRAAVGLADAHGVGDDAAEHLVGVEAGADRLAQVAQRLELLDLAGELGAPGLQRASSARPAAARWRPGRRRRSASSTSCSSNGSTSSAPDGEGADHLVVEDHRRRQQGPVAGQLLEVLAPVLRVGEDVGDLQRVRRPPPPGRASVPRSRVDGVRQRVQRGTPRGPAATCATAGRRRRRARCSCAGVGPAQAHGPLDRRCPGSRPELAPARASATQDLLGGDGLLHGVVEGAIERASRSSARTAARSPRRPWVAPSPLPSWPGRRIAATPVWIASPRGRRALGGRRPLLAALALVCVLAATVAPRSSAAGASASRSPRD